MAIISKIPLNEAFETVGNTINKSEHPSRTVVYTGAIQDIKEKAKDTTLSDNVISVNVKEEEGGVGTLTITYSDAGECADDTPQDGEPKATYELQMVETTQVLAAHPKFPAAHKTMEWPLFLASAREVQVQNKYTVDPNNPNSYAQGISTDLEDWAALYNAGIKEYKVYLPVVTKVQVYTSTFDEPTPENIGKKESPDKWNDLANEWLKTADNISYDANTKSYTRQQQWTGADEWPDLLYDNNSST